jgi:hypothetical protein
VELAGLKLRTLRPGRIVVVVRVQVAALRVEVADRDGATVGDLCKDRSEARCVSGGCDR